MRYSLEKFIFAPICRRQLNFSSFSIKVVLDSICSVAVQQLAREQRTLPDKQYYLSNFQAASLFYVTKYALPIAKVLENYWIILPEHSGWSYKDVNIVRYYAIGSYGLRH